MRHLERERHAWEATRAQRQDAHLERLRRELPEREDLLLGWPAILEHLAALGVARPGLHPVTAKTAQRWARQHGFPLARGLAAGWSRTPPATTTFAITGWLLATFSTGEKGLWRPCEPERLRRGVRVPSPRPTRRERAA